MYDLRISRHLGFGKTTCCVPMLRDTSSPKHVSMTSALGPLRVAEV